MNLIKAMIIAFSMYSKIPMPRVDWNEKNMKYALVFFPLIGAFIGSVILGWYYISLKLNCGEIFRGAVFVAIPILLTGGIHADGLLDTLDALHSYQPRERKLEILKDPHTGAFAVLGGIIYFILYFGAVTQVKDKDLWVLFAISFVMTRALSGLSLTLFKGAKKEGLLYTFSSMSHKKVTRTALLGIFILCGAGMFFINAMAAVFLLASSLLVFLYYRLMSYKEFGGITGDLAGFFLQICELVMILELAFFQVSIH